MDNSLLILKMTVNANHWQAEIISFRNQLKKY
ncbi:DUF29 domain-containing protein [Cyanothece sp. BG0011]|nr:DUF29 domain-containing protein [Cyanothece sp. BG0011]